MAATTEADPTLKKSLILLHSQSPQSATELRIMLDEMIKQRYGIAKMLCNTFEKSFVEWEKQAPGIINVPEQETGEIINLTNSPAKTISDSPDTVLDSDDGAMLAMATSEEVENLKEFGDLNCCICGEIMFTASNRLIECSQCGSLYHQGCHKPPITNEEAPADQDHSWQCNNCNNKPSTSKAAAEGVSHSASAAMVRVPEEPIALVSKMKSTTSSSRSSSSSNSSSPFYKTDHLTSTSSKHQKASPLLPKVKKDERPTGNASTRATSVITPSISTMPTKKSSTSHSSASKLSCKSSSSSSSSSRHHDSGGNKRKWHK